MMLTSQKDGLCSKRYVFTCVLTNLAQMVGITRLQVSHFMNKFRKLGFIDYSGNGGLKVQGGLLSVVLHD
jgi:hypothetical protein